MKSILGIETSGGACSAALWHAGAVVAAERHAMIRGHAEALVPMIERVLHAAHASYRDLAAVAVTVGPGAFTGLRIGLAAARGIALAAGIPAIGITAFEAVARAIPAAARAGRAVAVAIDTKRGDLYLQCFTPDLDAIGDGRVVADVDLAAALPRQPVYCAGDGVPLARQMLADADARDIVFDPHPAPPDGGSVAACAARRLAAASAALPPPVPLYLRSPEATPLAQQKKSRRAPSGR
jgi:tRNA threonylcarbamoyladenosine biosynthesis protein TsaB